MILNRAGKTSFLLVLLILASAVSCFTIETSKLSITRAQPWRRISRGGSSVLDLDDDKEEVGDDSPEVQEVSEEGGGVENVDPEEQDQSEDDEDDEVVAAHATSSAPVSILFKTNLGNALIDTKLELLVSRSRNVQSIKQTLSRMLPGRPPVESLRIVLEGVVLEDDQIVDDVFEEEDDEDEEAEHAMIMTLDMVPPVSPKFATEMASMHHMSTSEILDAYTANAAAMYHNGNAIVTAAAADVVDPEEIMLSIRLRNQAHEIRQQLEKSFPQKSLELLQSESPPSTEIVDERRGQRYRTSKGGVRTNLKRNIQTNLNINWADTIRNFLLFLFFGIFGGRNTVSRNLLILGAPFCFLIQARPIKIYLKQAFYACANPPGIFLSLLPAPQQAILSFDEAEARKALYGEPTKVVGKDDADHEASEDDESDEDSDDDDESDDDE